MRKITQAASRFLEKEVTPRLTPRVRLALALGFTASAALYVGLSEDSTERAGWAFLTFARQGVIVCSPLSETEALPTTDGTEMITINGACEQLSIGDQDLQVTVQPLTQVVAYPLGHSNPQPIANMNIPGTPDGNNYLYQPKGRKCEAVLTFNNGTAVSANHPCPAFVYTGVT